MAHTLPSSDQSSDQDKWDSGGLECKGQLLIKIVMRNRLTALVVDGDTTCWVQEQELLHSYGVQTLGVDNSRDAVDLIASDAEFNLIIIEKILPVLNGLEVTRQICEIGVRCKMLEVTACSGESERQAFLAIGVDVFIEKPLDPEHLVPILREVDGQ
ncbi:hypothetical protein ES319_D07G230000v1 [Gossypium barbadense]|uniref:Response regulatory domain-containing protein n=2 Tax=Gossypium TaxID=3633 RepID=A0A5J5QUL4_GOSBA|nr:hypothetical protein ES319_D07G230000v1 [Gossypium barbadense]PPD72492.1 hypothetical protein GOBAR_DD30603 [Gossypium barbadense]TYG62639.1 hypothetical protein ES288_D07G247600v1 [Gossypium darwinii]